jgi:hypothetical protein
MKRIDLIRILEEMGCLFIRHGKRHDWYQNPATKMAFLKPTPSLCIDSKLLPMPASASRFQKRILFYSGFIYAISLHLSSFFSSGLSFSENQ